MRKVWLTSALAVFLADHFDPVTGSNVRKAKSYLILGKPYGRIWGIQMIFPIEEKYGGLVDREDHFVLYTCST